MKIITKTIIKIGVTLAFIALSLSGYGLGLMSETKRDPGKIYLNPTTEGLQYEVIGLDGALNQKYTSKAGHTLAADPLGLAELPINEFKVSSFCGTIVAVVAIIGMALIPRGGITDIPPDAS
ncbi:MAG: hypothetical protein A3F18_02225 [Legionellales bacterium RIFCSPHIGHO2_12_FULL_37_14]|nr:MAG: hypothetical protein A3F18_02225 [Legionellales bacterium RIFCSPHIGHO2_12_FULL_37_14]